MNAPRSRDRSWPTPGPLSGRPDVGRSTWSSEHLAAIDDRSTGSVHAFDRCWHDEARRRGGARSTGRWPAGEDPGPLAGVPVALKDNLCTRGVPTTCSSRILDGWRPPYDATVVDPAAGAPARS